MVSGARLAQEQRLAARERRYAAARAALLAATDSPTAVLASYATGAADKDECIWAIQRASRLGWFGPDAALGQTMSDEYARRNTESHSPLSRIRPETP